MTRGDRQWIRLRERPLFVAALLGVLVLAWFGAYLQPRLDDHAMLQRDLRIAVYEQEARAALLADSSRLVAAQESVGNSQQPDSTGVLTELEAMRLVEGLGRRLRLEMPRISPLLLAGDDGVPVPAVAVDLEGEMESLVEFLYRIESSPQSPRIELLNMAPSRRTPGRMSANLTLRLPAGKGG